MILEWFQVGGLLLNFEFGLGPWELRVGTWKRETMLRHDNWQSCSG